MSTRISNEGSLRLSQLMLLAPALHSQVTPDSKADGNLNPDALRRLSEKLSELVGKDAVEGFNQARNEKGELVNEEGLPIIDITEPIATAAERGNGNVLLAEEVQLTPILSYPSSVRERWRKERDRILDLLETEERNDQVREEQVNEKKKQESLQKRKEAAAQEKAKLKAAKGMQKKLGKALLRGMAEARTKEEDSQRMPSDQEEKTKKTVTFADPGDGDSDRSAGESARPKTINEWGDITPARLRSTPGPSLLSQKQPMKLTVIERHPANQTTRMPATLANEPDSDDESELGFAADLEQVANSHSSPVHHNDNFPPDSDGDENLELEDENFDLREIVLQHHETRTKIGEAATAAMLNYSHSDNDDGRADVPLDVPSSEQPRPSISRFKASRIAASYNALTPLALSTSTSLGASVLPASSTRTLQRAIRTGKLDADERLVGGEADSASEEENEGMQEVLELLKKGEVYNLGPDGNHIYVVPPRTPGDKKQSITPAISLSTANNSQPNVLPPLHRPKTSKFKLSRSQPERQTPAIATIPSSPSPGSQDPTLISHEQRSSPKPAPAMTPIVIERLPLSTSAAIRSPPSNVATSTVPSVLPPIPISISPASANARSQAFSMVIDSPSFPKPQPRRSTATTASSPPLAVSRPSRPPTVVASAVRDPSDQKGSTGTITATLSNMTESPSFPHPARARNPPTVISSPVEKSNNQELAATDQPPKREKKVSKFMAKRI